MVYEARIYVKSPIILTEAIHFDALLSSVHPAMHNLGTHLTRHSNSKEVRHAPLPIDSAKCENTWVWCATISDFDNTATFFNDKFNKRKDHIDYMYLKKRYTPGTGPARDKMETAYGVLCKYVKFYYSTTDNKEVERILKRVRNLGALRKMGYGEVSGFETQETNKSWQECLVKDGEAQRNLPEEIADGDYTKICVHPPYWMPSNEVSGIMYSNKCTLKEGVWLNEVKRH